MEFIHLARNPSEKGLERVADIYIAKYFQISQTPVPTQEFLPLLAREDIPKYIRELIRKALKLEDVVAP